MFKLIRTQETWAKTQHYKARFGICVLKQFGTL